MIRCEKFEKKKKKKTGEEKIQKGGIGVRESK
jgi:hypothetical protein